ncbi:MAG: type II toxin-antitoxin system VapC family toxin [Nitrospirota bacterium]
MNPAPLRAVVDASVAVKIFVPEALSAQAQEVFARFASENGAELIVPDFFFIECANVLWKWVHRAGYPSKDVQEHLRDLTVLGLTVIPDQVVAEEALGIALKHQITAYDACYVAAGAQLRIPLITADEKLAMKLAKSSLKVHWLGDAQATPK